MCVCVTPRVTYFIYNICFFITILSKLASFYIGYQEYLFRTHAYNQLRELRPSREAVSCTATRDLPRIAWNPKIYCHFCKSPSVIPILSHINSVLFQSILFMENPF
jgi:hypothetical protein